MRSLLLRMLLTKLDLKVVTAGQDMTVLLQSAISAFSVSLDITGLCFILSSAEKISAGVACLREIDQGNVFFVICCSLLPVRSDCFPLWGKVYR